MLQTFGVINDQKWEMFFETRSMKVLVRDINWKWKFNSEYLVRVSRMDIIFALNYILYCMHILF